MTALSILQSAAEILRPPRRIPVADAAARYLHIHRPGGESGLWNPGLAPYMIEPMNRLADRTVEAVVFVGPARTGKCLSIETPIPTPSGWIKIGDIQCGDYVFGDDGKPTKVIDVSEVKQNRPCFRVEMSDGSYVITDDDHLWGVERFYWKNPNWRYEVKKTSDILNDLYYSIRKNGNKRYRYRIKNTQALDLPDTELSINPYLLGLWLGDGRSYHATIICHIEDAQFYIDRITAFGHFVETKQYKNKNVIYLLIDKRHKLTTHCQRGHDMRLVGRTKDGYCAKCRTDTVVRYNNRKNGLPVTELDGPPPMFLNTLQGRLNKLGLINNKHIPQSYLRASINQRMELLRGLMDTDGTFDKRKGSAEYTTVSKQLCDNVRELILSLGMKPSVAKKKTSCQYKGVKKTGIAYRITFPIPEKVKLFNLPRKANAFKVSTIDVNYRAIISITKVDSVPVKCIRVDNASHLFLAGDSMIPTHNTAALVLGWLTYAVCCDPGDFLLLNTSEATARDFSKDDIARAHRHSPELQARLSPYASDDNVFDKQYRHGMRLLIGWPSINQLSGRTLRYVAITDYDRMADNIDGEGDPYTLASKRVQTFLSGGRVCVESSPGWLIEDAKWQYHDPHEGPPCKGIFALYNQGDRRRWYWPCSDCGAYFTATPGPDAFIEVEGHVRLICPHCGAAIDRAHKKAMNAKGRWLAAGQTLDADGTLHGDAPKTKIASYWLTGPAAAYQSWESLWRKAQTAQEELEKTGAEDRLQAVIAGDYGMAYRPRQLHVVRDAQAMQNRAEDVQKRTLPEGVCFLTAAVDVQKNRFVVQVVGWGKEGERWLIDRYNLRWSRRKAGNDDPEPIDPAGRLEDWAILIDQVIRKPYPFAKDPTHGLRPLMTAVDSGGKAGVTERAYLFWRHVQRAGFHRSMMLVKGASTKDGPRIHRTYPDATKRQDRKANARGEIPVWLLNTLVLKDALAADMERTEPGPGYIHWPAWLGPWFFDELTAEVRTAKGWENPGGARNEAMDLMVYNHAAWLALRAERLNWANPPAWADPVRSAILIETASVKPETSAPAPAPKPQPAKPRTPFINHPAGVPWIR